MKKDALPLDEISISELFNSAVKKTFEVPVYQRNYAWEKDEIAALIHDVCDSFQNSLKVYYIGTLVSYHRGDNVYEVIDGQQRLTTIRLILGALGITPGNRLTYRARKKSDDTLSDIPAFNRSGVEDWDNGIINGYRYADTAIKELGLGDKLKSFTNYFLNNVHIIHYRVPKDIDLNHYFEIMNSRGEQLEKHEIIKARLLSKLTGQDERTVFNFVWECCSEMGVYIQQRYSSEGQKSVFGDNLCDFLPRSFGDIKVAANAGNHNKASINELLGMSADNSADDQEDKPDSFQPIIDFSNFLLIVLKLTRISDPAFNPDDFNLDDKELINEFNKVETDAAFVKQFGYNLLKAKYLLDNYMVHHSNEEDTVENNPWKLERWQKDSGKGKGYLKNLFERQDTQDYAQNKAVHLLSMFEVSFTARQRKNYLFYCLMYLFSHDIGNLEAYLRFIERLAEKYFNDVYLVAENLNAINTPLPGSFDKAILVNNRIDAESRNRGDARLFESIYGDGTLKSRGIPLFIFNYADYRLWDKYASEMRGFNEKTGSARRNGFFESLGCSDFGLAVFTQFYFSRTRRSLEHFYPQANANGEDGKPDESQINCFGNYAMIGGNINSSGSNWTPNAKLIHYRDGSEKVPQVSVASLKFMIMMQMCKDNDNKRVEEKRWMFEDIQKHQRIILNILMHDRANERTTP